MRDGTGNTGRPMRGIGTQTLLGTVGISQFQNAAESAFEAQHGIPVSGGDNLVSPPAGGYLDTELILCTGLAVQGRSDVIGKGALGLGIMGETGLQHFLSNQAAIYVQVIHSQAGGHPDRFFHFLSILDGGKEPTGTGGAGINLLTGALCHRGIHGGNPLRNVPGRIFEGGDQRKVFRIHVLGRTSNHGGGHGCDDKSKRQLFHIGIVLFVC